jgi:transposase
MTEKEMNKILIIKSLLDEKIDIETAQKRLNVGERSIYRYIKRFKEN